MLTLIISEVKIILLLGVYASSSNGSGRLRRICSGRVFPSERHEHRSQSRKLFGQIELYVSSCPCEVLDRTGILLIWYEYASPGGQKVRKIIRNFRGQCHAIAEDLQIAERPGSAVVGAVQTGVGSVFDFEFTAHSAGGTSHHWKEAIALQEAR